MTGTKNELNELSEELRKQAEEMKQAFADLERSMKGLNKYVRPTVEKLLKEGHKWEGWYAWRPVRDIHGEWHWLKNICRIKGNTYVDHEDWAWYYYGTILDIVRTTK